MSHHTVRVRPLSLGYFPAIRHLTARSEYLYQRFNLADLKHILHSYPSVGLFHGRALRSFLLTQNLNAPSAWLAGFGSLYAEDDTLLRFLDCQLGAVNTQLRKRGITHLYYSGSDLENDWLRDPLFQRGFTLFHRMYAYDKTDDVIPTQGNQEVTLRRACEQDLPALLTLESLCFEQLWRYNALTFSQILNTHPYFVVVEWHGQVIGYQFNALDDEYGYLVRIAVHPAYESHGIGARLMAEAVHFFAMARVTRIMLNTPEENIHAHRLYEWFGFERISQMGFILQKAL